MKAIVIYQTKYGSCRQYAEWISEALDCILVKADQVQAVNVSDYDLMIFGAPIYAGRIDHHQFYDLNPAAKLIIFTVGMVNPDEIDFEPYLQRNFPQHVIERAKFFHFRGALNFANLSWYHKLLLWAMKKFHLDKMEFEELKPEERVILEAYGQSTSYLDRSSIQPLIDYVRRMDV